MRIHLCLECPKLTDPPLFRSLLDLSGQAVDTADQIAEADEIIDESIAAQILQKGYLERMRAQYPDAETILVLNQADDDCLRERAVKLANLAGEDAKILSLKKEFEKIANFIEQK